MNAFVPRGGTLDGLGQVSPGAQVQGSHRGLHGGRSLVLGSLWATVGENHGFDAPRASFGAGLSKVFAGGCLDDVQLP